ncbi:GNAT family N-acetyltransferase [Acinetobacter sp. 3657]|uniref:GNAT family N-acetyltransferase n=1 Tax=Acinetobacter sp. 3657 TaxID=2817764 RepID=UPI00285E4692|nr:GNAT superfamily N-acetyltransferase [Prolinoborus sp. 3657]
MVRLDKLRIEKVLDLPVQLDALIESSKIEGFRFLERLKYDFQNGENCFNQLGEALFTVYEQNRLIAICGLNQNPYDDYDVNKVGRIRRFYIHPLYRRKGVGHHLLSYIERYARAYFNELQLFTDTENAANFYQMMGYEKVALPHTSFRKIFM